MKKNFTKNLISLGKTAFLVLALLIIVVTTKAQTTTFAQFNERVGGQDFVFTNNVSNASFQTINTGSPVSFTYLNVTGLPAELQGPQAAHVFIFSTTTAPATTSSGNRVIQPFNSTFSIQILRDTPYNGKMNLLSATILPAGASNPELSGDQGATSAGFSASTPVQNVTFTSQFISFTGSSNRDLSLAFSSVQPIYSLGTTFVNSFSAAGAGTFAANQPPIFLIPTAAGVSVSGQVLTPKSGGLSGARVTLTNSAGQIFSTLTDANGFYQFSDIIAGDTVIINVKSKFYAYPTQVLNLSDEINGLTFVPQYSKVRIR